MGAIDEELQAIMDARYGKDVRQAIHDGLKKMDEIAETAQTSAASSATSAAASATTASGYVTDCEDQVDLAEAEVVKAKAEVTNCQTEVTNCKAEVTNCQSEVTNCQTEVTNATTQATASKSWAVGGTGTREGEDTDNAYYWYTQAKGVSGDYIPTSEKGVAGGVATLDTNGLVPDSQVHVPTASADTLGGIKVGNNLTITDGVLSADAQEITVDDALSDTSENPVQNKVIKSALGNYALKTDLDDYTTKTESQSMILTFTDLSVATSEWVSDDTYGEYPFRADVACNGVTTSHVPTVTFSLTDVKLNILAPIAESGTNVVSIYASEQPSNTVSVVSIVANKEV